jgi:hypothetical protein
MAGTFLVFPFMGKSSHSHIILQQTIPRSNPSGGFFPHQMEDKDALIVDG